MSYAKLEMGRFTKIDFNEWNMGYGKKVAKDFASAVKQAFKTPGNLSVGVQHVKRPKTLLDMLQVYVTVPLSTEGHDPSVVLNFGEAIIDMKGNYCSGSAHPDDVAYLKKMAKALRMLADELDGGEHA